VVRFELKAAWGRSAPRRGKLAATAAQETARGGGGEVTGVDQRPRGRGVVVVRFEGRMKANTFYTGVDQRPRARGGEGTTFRQRTRDSIPLQHVN
jgi:hypothetical protein